MDGTIDLGALDGPVLAFGGPYGNRQATEALLAAAAAEGIPPGRVVCTGDVVAYCADGQAAVDLLRRAGVAVVMGNCEESLGWDAESCGCGFAEGTACDALARAWYAHARAHLDDGARAWMRALPRRITFRLNGRPFAVVHGSATRINRYLFPSAAEAVLAHELDAAGADAVVAGHSGIPFTRRVGARLWHNPGAIGLPANDGTRRVWYATLAPEAGGVRIRHRALRHDRAGAARRMRAAGLPAGYADCLETGLWPSLDVLPPPERAATGRPLDPPDLLWA